MTEPDSVAQMVARTVRSVRTAHNFGVADFATHAGMTEESLIALEEGGSVPRLETLIQVSDALGIPLARLVEGEPEPIVRILPPEKQHVLWHGPHGGSGRLIVGSDLRPALELWKWRLEPGEARDGAPHPAGDREVAYVDEGVLTLTIDGHRFEVPQGTAAIFVGDRPHRYANEQVMVLHYTITLADP